MPYRLLPRRLLVDGFERQGYFDEFLFVRHLNWLFEKEKHNDGHQQDEIHNRQDEDELARL